jgi:hypothetical protein
MHVTMHESRDGGVHQSVTLDLRPAAKRGTHELDTKVSAFARAGVSGVRRAVIRNVEGEGRKLLLERCPQARHALGAHAR